MGDREDDVFVPYARCQRLLVAPRVADHDCSRRTIKSTPTAFAAAFAAGAEAVSGRERGQAVSADFLRGMSNQPLEPLELGVYVVETEAGADRPLFMPPARNTFSSSEEQMEPAQNLKEIFDLSSHPEAQDYTAGEMLRRLDDDVRHYASTHSNKMLYINGLTPEDVYECVAEAKDGRTGNFFRGSRLEQALSTIAFLIGKLQDLQDDDVAQMAAGMQTSVSLVNSDPNVGATASEPDLVHHLRCSAGDEVSSQLSTDCGAASIDTGAGGIHADQSAACNRQSTHYAHEGQCRHHAAHDAPRIHCPVPRASARVAHAHGVASRSCAVARDLGS